MRKPVIDDMFRLKAVSRPRASLGGKVAFSVGGSFREPRSTLKSAVYVYAKERGVSRLTSGEWLDREPAFTEGGEVLGFLSNRGRQANGSERTTTALFVLSLDGSSEVWRAPVPGLVEGFEWVSPNSALVASLDEESREREQRKAGGFDVEEFEDPSRYVSLWHFNADTLSAKQITRRVQVWEFSPDSRCRKVALTYSALPFERHWYRAKLGVLDTADGELKCVYDPGWRQVGAPRLSPEGKRILFTSSLWSDRGSQLGDLHLVNLEGGEHTNLTDGAPYSVSWAEWLDEESAIFLAQRESESVFFRIEAPEWTPRELRSMRLAVNPAWYPKFTVLNKNPLEVAFSAQNNATPSEIWVAALENTSNNTAPVTAFNAELKQELDVPRLEFFEWTNTRGERLTGYLEGLENLGDKPCPLVVHVHGGPTSSVRTTYLSSLGSLLACQGYLVFYPNYTGSVGRGLAFAESNRGDLGGQDFRDIVSGVEAVRANYNVDPERVYLEGGSYGGFMAMWAATQTDVFAAIAALFGVSDWLSFHGTSNLSDWDEIHLAESPYKYTRYDAFSPIRHVGGVNTPILLLHGKEDPYVPIGQSLQFYRALSDLGREVKLVVYPREGHGFTEKPHVKDAYTRVSEWFRTHTRKPRDSENNRTG
ncbi:hypothetical protein B9Q03_12485 [Candidatus Marsarchaeota G2 archaeon OSP_D]|uniref:Peptidase S9 prolyl oligopeptidase catalytic domain-containing protein n=2 Tax=Candidatus Marsarchaeota group 2 TaxID=2203771 RepID=A0A2R6AFM8_9ARCH|nr:MAG: hypothetical protein B9Q03_12485 [Candidatus Marsarchaeota G2 archaeon OSP_D]